MNATRDYEWSTVCAWGLTASGAALGLFGVIGMFSGADLTAACITAFSVMLVFAVISVNCAAAALIHAVSRPGGWKRWHWPTVILSLACTVGFAVAANIGVHMGWALMAARAAHPETLPDAAFVNGAFLFLSFAKPALSCIVEGRRMMDSADEALRQAAGDARAQELRLAEIHARAPAPSPAQTPPASVETPAPESKVRDLKTARDDRAKQTGRAIAAAVAAGGVALSGAANAASRQGVGAETAASRPIGTADVLRACDILERMGMTPSYRLVAKQLAVPVSRVERAWKTGVPLSSKANLAA